ncbi:hypothetical protein [Methylocapsa sp. S129]|uniref:hypothetical protein n=1 Tax=Methylocapsa sp. S129 TaxID=1641869 RepID=UPI00131B0F1B|nr:hypothetical protein [Methylocapsa sp. S129]
MISAPRRASIGNMLAYVDNCLPQQDRAALEDRMIEYPELKSQVDLWLLQNEAIRAAFPDPSLKAASTGGGDFARGSFAPDHMRWSLRTIREGKELDRRPHAAPGPTGESLPVPLAAPLAPARQAKPKRNARAIAQWALRPLAGALALWAGSAAVFSSDQSGAFAGAATAAYRAFADNATHPVEIATSDRDALNKWFAPQIVRAAPVPDLAASGLTLLGGRIAPGAFLPAGFALYENRRHERFALEVEALDSPPQTDVEIRESGAVLCASWTEAGHSFALIGRASRTQMMALARLIREGQPKG